MDSTAPSAASDKRRWLALAGLAAVPVYVLPVGLWGVRALWPRMLRDAASGAVLLGMMSLVGLSLRGLVRVKAKLPGSDRWMKAKPPGSDRWKLPLHRQILPDEFAASAASGH